MFDASFPEFVLVLIIGLLILGPERLPRVASKIGRWVGKARRTASQLRHQLEREIALSDIGQPPKKRNPPQKPAPPPERADAGSPANEAPTPEAPGDDAHTPAASDGASGSPDGEPSDPAQKKSSNEPPAA